MADRTQQILPGGQGAAPFTYTIPASTAFTLLGVKATFDGTGAGGNFLPCVQLVSDAGVVMAFGLGSSVTAGGSADVSFAPFLRPNTSATTGGGIDFEVYPQSGPWLEVEASGRFPQSVYDDLDLRFPGMAGPGWSDFGTLLLAINGDTGIVAPDGTGAIDIIALKSGFSVLNMEAWQWFGDFAFVRIGADHDMDIQASGSADMTIGASGTGHLIFNNLPVVNPGGSGRVWNNAGVLSIT